MLLFNRGNKERYSFEERKEFFIIYLDHGLNIKNAPEFIKFYERRVKDIDKDMVLHLPLESNEFDSVFPATLVYIQREMNKKRKNKRIFYSSNKKAENLIALYRLNSIFKSCSLEGITGDI